MEGGLGGLKCLTKLSLRSLENTNPVEEKHIQLPADERKRSEIIPF